MCGIIGCVGPGIETIRVITNGIKIQNNRGYDSWGVGGIIHNGKGRTIRIVKKAAGDDEFQDFEEKVLGLDWSGCANGIGHNRWATNGSPTDENAHPHSDCTGKIALVHNGIIENFREIHTFLTSRGHTITSETDTELITHMIEEKLKVNSGDLHHAVMEAVNVLQGAFAFLMVHSDYPDMQIAAKIGSPLTYAEILPGTFMVASTPLPFIEFTREGTELEDRQVLFIEDGTARVRSFDDEEVHPDPILFEGTPEELELEGFPHFMLKEIFEQPSKLEISGLGRFSIEDGLAKLGGIEDALPLLEEAEQFIFLGSGTSFRAGLVGAWMFEEFLDVRSRAIQASEVTSRNILAGCNTEKTIVFCISQSGETRDLITAIEEMQRREVVCFGIVNVVGSKISRMTDGGVYLRVGPEIGVASTKAYTATIQVEALLTLLLARQKGMSRDEGNRFAKSISLIPEAVRHVLRQNDRILSIAKEISKWEKVMILGRGYHYATALEGGLKLTEVAYVAAVAELAGEMKHGPIALIEEGFPIIVVATNDSVRLSVFKNIDEVKSRGARVTGICTTEDSEMIEHVHHYIDIPNLPAPLATIPAAVVMQLFAYHVGVLRGHTVDKPRNLAKTVTVD